MIRFIHRRNWYDGVLMLRPNPFTRVDLSPLRVSDGAREPRPVGEPPNPKPNR